MRKILTPFFFSVCTLIHAQVKENLTSKIEKVTVFLSGAQVERSYKGVVNAGKQQLVFGNISPQIDKQSIQVTANGSLIVLSVLHQQNFMKEKQKLDEIKNLEAKKEMISGNLINEKNNLAVFIQEESMLAKNQQIGGNDGIKAVDLKESLDFQRSRLTEIYQKKQEINKRVIANETELNKINRQLAELNQQTDLSTSEIIVSVDCKVTGVATILISYLVQKAGWYPTYNIRVKDISSPIQLQYKANIYQHSGEDWKDIKMWLSNGNPNEKGDKPLLSPWHLRFNSVPAISTVNENPYYPDYRFLSGRISDESGKPVPYASILIKGTNTGVASDGQGNFRINATAPSNILVVSAVGYESRELVASSGSTVNVNLQKSATLEEVVVVGYGSSNSDEYSYNNNSFRRKKDKSSIETITSYQPTAVIYEIKDPYSVPDDGKTYTADIDAYEIDALFEYYAAPKLEPDVYLTAKIVDWQELNLEPGEANLFFENTFLGQSFLDVNNAGDTLKLSLGKDKGVVIRRKLMKEYSSRKLIGSNKTESRQYEITVRNNKQQDIHIIVEDQLPVSTEKEIEIKEKKYEGAKLDNDTQIVTWDLNLPSKKETKLNIGYDVKYPKEKLLHLD
ncbi:MAG: mucoidy inhibitor MuiA family protein [Terrimonas sp.]|nr:mucoidy inhibitor MuiA family protein [Terrimonas sp.]